MKNIKMTIILFDILFSTLIGVAIRNNVSGYL